MNKLLLILGISVALTACSTQVKKVYVPVKTICPTIPYNTEYKPSDLTIKVKVYKDKVEISKEDFKSLIGAYKECKLRYNITIETIKKFNKKVITINKGK